MSRDALRNDDVSDLHDIQLHAAARVARSRLPALLDYKEIIGRLPELNDWYKQVADREKIEEWIGCEYKRPSSDNKNVVYDRVEKRGRLVRASGLVFRCIEEMTSGGFPVFNTLTLDPAHEYVIGRRREEFKLWTRKMRRQFGEFTYCGVTERGEEGRLHMHVLMVFENGSQFSDPNFGKPDGDNQLVPELRGCWPYGFDTPIAARFSPLDMWGRIGWRWPKGLTTNPEEALALYMAKYLTKETEMIEGCRTKTSRNFGLQSLMAMTNAQALMVVNGHPNLILPQLKLKSTPPEKLLRYVAEKKIFGKAPLLPLPKTKAGSVQLAAESLGIHRSSRMNAGDCLNPVADFNSKEFDQYRQTNHPVQIGRI